MLNRRQLLTASAASAVALGTANLMPAAAASQTAYGRTFTDLGCKPAVINVEKLTLKNKNFRTAAWSCDQLQLTLMNIPVGGEVGLEMHDDVDQFLRIESGTALVMMGDEKLFSYVKQAGSGDAILVPSGTWHNIVNNSPQGGAEAVLPVRPAAAPHRHHPRHVGG
ncbi:cupin domain-containing protein [Luteococcus sp. Sow4_B9]|uniref:cupin domain-containing protein n=1 Tax=Luteococcus sp. Sow4_B9 TaxID=3438792 RepID=UPI003F981A1D